jgi:phage terminase large subunit-like protein
MSASPVEVLQALPEDEQNSFFDGLSEDEAESLLQSWDFWARPEQLEPPGDWVWWLLITGRGWGKNRTGAEWVVTRCEQFTAAGVPHLVGLVGQTNDDVRSTMIGGVSGLKRVVERRGHRWEGAPNSLNPKIKIWREETQSWHTTSIEIHTAIEPEGPRGRNFNTAWLDELAAYKHKVDTVGNTVFTNVELALRGEEDDLSARSAPAIQPRAIVTTTPKPIPVIRSLLSGKHGPTVITRGSLYDNRANLPQSFVDAVTGMYEGTRLAEQEIHGKVIDSVEGALWNPDIIHRWRIQPAQVPALSRVVIGVDPSGSESEGDDCGIVVVGLARDRDQRGRPHLYVLEDASSPNRPEKWARIAVDLARKYDATIVAEVNFGAALVRDVVMLTARNDEAELPQGEEPLLPIRFEEVRASRGKRVRAEPVALMYDPGQGRVHHVGVFPQLEEQMTFWTPLDPTSPDRMDALVWACAYLIPELTTPPAGFAKGWADRRAA